MELLSEGSAARGQSCLLFRGWDPEPRPLFRSMSHSATENHQHENIPTKIRTLCGVVSQQCKHQEEVLDSRLWTFKILQDFHGFSSSCLFGFCVISVCWAHHQRWDVTLTYTAGRTTDLKMRTLNVPSDFYTGTFAREFLILAVFINCVWCFGVIYFQKYSLVH